MSIKRARQCGLWLYSLSTSSCLDDRLSQGINALFSVPMMTASGNSAPIVIISNEPDAPHLADVERLGVQHVISKADLKPFLEEWLSVNT